MNTDSSQVIPEVVFDHGIPKTTSLEVARIFAKRHDNALRDIRQLLQDLSPEFALLNFEECFRERAPDSERRRAGSSMARSPSSPAR